MNATAYSPQQVFEWLESEAQTRHIQARIHTKLVKEDHGWLYIPVYVEGGDAFDKAAILQALEDAWNFQEPEPNWQLLLIPAAN